MECCNTHGYKRADESIGDVCQNENLSKAMLCIKKGEKNMTKAERIAHLLNTDWQPIDTLLRQGYNELQIIRSYTLPATR